MKRIVLVSAIAVALSVHGFASPTFADSLFESGTLGPTGIPWQDVYDQLVFGENVSGVAFNGARFEIIERAVTTQVGGHFVGPPNSDTTLFAAIIALDNANDFPNSIDLSTPDVLGTTLLTVPDISDDIAGNLALELSPGWYALVFGSGLFGAEGDAAALLNNTDVGSPDYIGFLTGFGWGSRLPGKHFFVTGEFVPEPSSFALAFPAFLLLHLCRLPLTLKFSEIAKFCRSAC